MSDRQKGLIQAMNDLLPGIEYRHYCHNLHDNFKKLHQGDALKDLMRRCIKDTYVNKFETDMQELKNFDEEAYKWLQKKYSSYLLESVTFQRGYKM